MLIVKNGIFRDIEEKKYFEFKEKGYQKVRLEVAAESPKTPKGKSPKTPKNETLSPDA